MVDERLAHTQEPSRTFAFLSIPRQKASYFSVYDPYRTPGSPEIFGMFYSEFSKGCPSIFV
ncbi:unnamed protein product [Timema podura]|uniref:Uncharacterized protein n=1 Tax=Timema podura TaxID=61482 RepID=A0ABN7NQX2_TIMPD|nr:unnamed protein product [Timema podura]